MSVQSGQIILSEDIVRGGLYFDDDDVNSSPAGMHMSWPDICDLQAVTAAVSSFRSCGMPGTAAPTVVST